MDILINKIISEIKTTMDDHAHGAMSMPSVDLCKYGEVVGAYRGLQHALNIIDKVLSDGDEHE